MIGTISKLFGGNKSEKDVKKITPQVEKINRFFTEYQSLSNDELRNKTAEFKQRIATHLNTVNTEITGKQKAAEELPIEDINGRDNFYKEIDELKKEKDGYQSKHSRSRKQDKIRSENSCDGTAGAHCRHDGGCIREDMQKDCG